MIELYKLKNSYHKERMLIGLYIAVFVSYLFLSIGTLIKGETEIFLEKFFVSIVLIVLFSLYLKFKGLKRFFILLVILLELDALFTVYRYPSLDFIVVIPFIMIFGFFYFLKMKEAVFAVILHYIYWAGVFITGLFLYKEGHSFFNHFSVLSLFSASLIILIFGMLYKYLIEISYKKVAERNKQNILMLNEIHHRIKNNLNMIASILGLQILSMENQEDERAKEVLRNSKLRIEAIAMIHDNLYKERHIKKVKFQNYIENLTLLVCSTYNKEIDVKVEADDIFLSFETMFKIGLILNELLTNSLKYAFEDGEKGKIYIKLNRKGEEYILTYLELGNENVDTEKILNSKSLGIKLIKLITKQMNASLSLSSKEGLKFVIKFHNLPILSK